MNLWFREAREGRGEARGAGEWVLGSWAYGGAVGPGRGFSREYWVRVRERSRPRSAPRSDLARPRVRSRGPTLVSEGTPLLPHSFLQLLVPVPGAVMSGFDDPGIFYSDSFGGDNAADEGQARKSQLQRRFKEFLRQYRVGTDRTGFTFKYRCELGPGGRGRCGPAVLCPLPGTRTPADVVLCVSHLTLALE